MGARNIKLYMVDRDDDIAMSGEGISLLPQSSLIPLLLSWIFLNCRRTETARME